MTGQSVSRPDKKILPGEMYDYIWDYLIPENNNRSETLYKIVQPYLKNNETVLDMVCGFSPLTSFLTERHNDRVIGFDINRKSITYCKKKYDKTRTTFYAESDQDFYTDKPVNVHLHLGLSPSTNPLEPANDALASIKYIILKSPRLVILETATQYIGGLEKVVDDIHKIGNYRKVEEKTYTIEFNGVSINPSYQTALERKIVIFEKVSNQSSYSLNDRTLAKLLFETSPSAQNVSYGDLNIGFGYMYYALARNLRPQLTVVFGSIKGFGPICFALGARDNHNGGKVIFVDAGYSDKIDGRKGMGGVGFWRDQKKTQKLISSFGLDNVLQILMMRTEEFAELYKKEKQGTIDLLFIDADHSYKGFQYDFETFSELMSERGVMAFHDVLVDRRTHGYGFGVKDYFDDNIYGNPNFESFRLPVWPGICLVQKVTSGKFNHMTPEEFLCKDNELLSRFKRIYSKIKSRILKK